MITPETIIRVREGWAVLAPQGPAAAALFYEELFASEPRLAARFDPARMSAQHANLAAALDAAIAGLDDLATLAPILAALGARHAGYGASAADYDAVGRALLATLARALAQHWSPADAAAWSEVYAVLAATMQSGVTADVA